MKKTLILFAMILYGTLSSEVSFAKTDSARLAINLLDYVAADYAGAVKDGKILSASEYHEQLEFITTVGITVRDLPAIQGDKAILKSIENVRALVIKKAPASEVARLAQEAKHALITKLGITMAPASWPSLKRGRESFAQNCVACHGQSGLGDGAGAKGLHPSPTNFHDEKLSAVSPFQAFNTIRVGVPGTAMASFPSLTDEQVWDLAFYALSFRHQGKPSNIERNEIQATLSDVASLSDLQLKAKFKGPSGSEKDADEKIAVLRTLEQSDDNDGDHLKFARDSLDQAYDSYTHGNADQARVSALKAYLEGIEPIEPKIRANDPEFTSELEEHMAAVRGKIEGHANFVELRAAIDLAEKSIEHAASITKGEATPPWAAFAITVGILLREGFEAVLLLIALLAVLRVSGNKKAAHYVHGGWISAVALGFAAWFLSGLLMKMSGAGREMMEAVTSVFAVVILLYVGFWLHSKTEIYRWKAFIDERVKASLSAGSLFGLAVISFTAVFREAFETVLFLRALWIELGSQARTALTLGVFSSLGGLLIISWVLVRFSAKLPVRKVFSISSVLMMLLAIILSGKGIHSFQETGLLGVTLSPIRIKFELLGIFPTLQTLLTQVSVLFVSIFLWRVTSKPSNVRNLTRESVKFT